MLSDFPTPASSEQTPVPGKEDTTIPRPTDTDASIPVKDESAIPMPAETPTPVTQENSTSMIEANSVPVTIEPAMLMTEENAIPMDDINNLDSNEPSVDPDVKEDLDELIDNISLGLKALTWLGNVCAGILVFFLQFWDLLISSTNVNNDLTGFLAGIYLIMLAGLVKFKKLKSTDTARCLALLAAILGVTLLLLHSWSIYLCRNWYGYCTAFHTNPETLNESAAANCRWFTQRVIIDSLMVGCGVLIIIFNGVFLFFASTLKTRMQ